MSWEQRDEYAMCKNVSSAALLIPESMLVHPPTHPHWLAEPLIVRQQGVTGCLQGQHLAHRAEEGAGRGFRAEG